MDATGPVDRRTFLATSGALVAGAAVGAVGAPLQPARTRLALAGTGSRGSGTWGQDLVGHYADRVELVGLFDRNGLRARAAQRLIGTTAPVFADFDTMVRQARPDAVIVATVDATHAHYIVRALELGVDVLTEKPMCTDEAQCQAILDAVRRTGRTVTVTLNARHSREAKKVKALLQEGAIGECLPSTSTRPRYQPRRRLLPQVAPVSRELRDAAVPQGVTPFRPGELVARLGAGRGLCLGRPRVYGRNSSFRGTNCRTCAHRSTCPFAWDVTASKRNVALYVECESEDGYLRDGCVFDERIDIYDTMSVTVRYANRAMLTYTAAAHLPFEGQAVSFNGTRGRLDYIDMSGGGHAQTELRLTPRFGSSQKITDLPPSGKADMAAPMRRCRICCSGTSRHQTRCACEPGCGRARCRAWWASPRVIASSGAASR